MQKNIQKIVPQLDKEHNCSWEGQGVGMPFIKLHIAYMNVFKENFYSIIHKY